MAEVQPHTVESEESRTSHSLHDEKKEHAVTDEHELEEEAALDDHDVTKPFPIDPEYVEETHQLTVRAIVVGCALGCVVGASNIYLGLKTGFTFGPQLFGAIFGFAIIKAMVKLPIIGGSFGPKENCTVQSAATAAGGLGILFVSAVPAMYRLGLFENPSKDIGKLIALAAASGFFGVFFVIPLRKYYIVHQKLTFPTPAATAYTIRSLHHGKSGAITARKKSLALLYTFIICFVFKVMTGYAPGILYDWHIGWTLYRIGFTSIISLDNYGWWIEFTPAFYGAGMLSGLNASWSFFLGTVLAWGVIAPSLVKNGLAVGVQIDPDNWPDLYSYQALNFKDANAYVDSPSPRYWLLWPGVLIMLLYSFADITVSLLPMLKGIKGSSFANPFKRREVNEEDEDQTPMEDRIPFLWWSVGLFLSTVMSCAILATQFGMNVGEAILALICGFLFSFIGVQSSGVTDINPVSTVAKATQLIFGGIGKGVGLAQDPGRLLNLSAGVIAAGSAAQASDMTGDLKTGYLLRAKPKNQFVAQLCGSLVSVFLTAGLFILFTKASPCIINPPADGRCTYGAPSVSAWSAVAIAVTSPRLPIPKSSGITAIVLGIASVLTVLAKHFLIPRKHWKWIPNWNAIGLGFVVPQVYYSFAMVVGSSINYFWMLRNPANFDMYMFAIAAGLLAGEGLGGVFQALLAVVGVDGSKFGTAIGCPANEFCG